MNNKIFSAIFVILILLLFSPLCRCVYAENYIVKFVDTFKPVMHGSSLQEINAKENLYIIYDTNDLKELSEYIDYIENDVTVELAEPEGHISATQAFEAENNDSLAWQLEMINSYFPWGLATYGNNVNVAVIDSGCNQHIDIKDNLAGGYNYILNTDDYSDNIGHGTHVSGIIAAEHNGFGIDGIAPKSKIYALKCFDNNYQTTVSMLIRAIYDAIDVYKCKVINLSWGLKADRQALHDAVKYAVNNGVIVIAAVGNDGNDTMYYPAAYEEVIGVGSIGREKERSSFSQTNSSVFVVAPGETFLSLSGDDGYEVKQGTSQAAPVVTGITALILSAKPGLNAGEYINLLKASVDDVGESGYDTSFGYGVVNAESMLKSVMGSYYTSPIMNGVVLIYNNTMAELHATGIWLKKEEKLYNVKIEDIFVPPKQSTVCKFEGENVKFLLWDLLKTMKPLTIMRKEG